MNCWRDDAEMKMAFPSPDAVCLSEQEETVMEEKRREEDVKDPLR